MNDDIITNMNISLVGGEPPDPEVVDLPDPGHGQEGVPHTLKNQII